MRCVSGILGTVCISFQIIVKSGWTRETAPLMLIMYVGLYTISESITASWETELKIDSA